MNHAHAFVEGFVLFFYLFIFFFSHALAGCTRRPREIPDELRKLPRVVSLETVPRMVTTSQPKIDQNCL